ncbi:hypothetical protein [Microbacterium sp. Leaf203]|uniref:hypothetical protein n=1 Tax=Microbacterium sp. Leaf203 TaxID=1735677 RepID=UPI0006F570D6|nr:hypothetical protein [Microbacterium sp. Leaf203]KQM38396.1 hypothetical protein ASE56_14020 [Microbacterium sp. Leaf203]
MANIFVKGQKLAATALALLRRQVKAPGLFTYKFGISDFKGAEGDVVNIKRPAVLVAREKPWRGDDAIVVDRLANSKIQVKLNRHIYSAVALSPEEETLDEVDYVRDVQAPQVQAILDFFENIVVGALRVASFVFGVTFNPASGSAVESDARKVAVRARKLAQKAHWPLTGRYWLVGANVSEAIATHDKLLEVDAAGLPEALREGVVGRLGGWTIVELDALGDDESYFVHETAIAIATVAPAVPNGVAKGGGVAAGNGLAVTQLWDYDSDHLKDRSIVHAFAGATAVLDPEQDADTGAIIRDENDEVALKFQRAIKVTFGAGGSEKASYTLTITGAPTGGTFTITVDGQTTDAIAYNASNTDIAKELNELTGVSGAKVSGGNFPGNAKTVTFNERIGTLTATGAFTGGTSPAIAAA